MVFSIVGGAAGSVHIVHTLTVPMSWRGVVRALTSAVGSLIGIPVAAGVADGWIDEARRAFAHLTESARQPFDRSRREPGTASRREIEDHR